jgi:CHAD domain-containing protein/HD superfamily phosphodiesterase
VKTIAKTTGLRYWMLRALEECDRAGAAFGADPVHDLRVALRRCRSMADGMMAMDPEPDWKAMKKAGKRLFRSLGELRDVQIMMEWIDRLHPATSMARVSSYSGPAEEKSNPAEGLQGGQVEASGEDPQSTRDAAAEALLGILRQRETEQKHLARAALEQFDRKQWRRWAKSLPHRAARVRPGSAVFKHLALERWTAARELHTRAMRNRSQIALHTLRIGIKRFRYIVENFLPEEHKAWSKDLKHMQDLLGEVHDLDVLWATALACRVFHDAESRKTWRERILEERAKRVEEYREKTVGPDSLWHVWRAGLPQGKQIQQIATQRMKLWAKALDPDFAHSERVARLALELYDGLNKARLFGASPQNGSSRDDTARSSLYIAALLHDVGKSQGEKGHHKASRDLIQSHGTPLGWSEETMRRVALVARFHCGALPARSHKALRDLLANEQKVIIQLAAILRLANALDAEHDGRVRHVKMENAALVNGSGRRRNGFVRKLATLDKNEALVIGAEGYLPGTRTAQTIAAERYLLETVLKRPVVLKPVTSHSQPVGKARLPA